MQCPVDGETLVMADRQGVEIDYCPKCRGVWLDRGELDKIIDRAAPAASSAGPAMAPPVPPRPAAPPPVHHPEPRRARHDDDDDDDYRRRPRRRESFLSDIFDF